MSGTIAFGTDGVRGPAGVWPLDEAGGRVIGRAVALHAGGGPVVLGWDTRASSPSLAAAVEAGLRAGGARVLRAGVVPTPAVSVAVPALGAAAGIVITASHNPWVDNGVKALGPDGHKPADEAGLAALMSPSTRDLGDPDPGAEDLADPAGPWRAALPSPDLRGLRVLLDCAHGAAAPHAPAVLAALGATLTLRGCAPDGRNINDGVGALHPPTDLQGCDVAICLDGDGDRLAMVTRDGPLDGDALLWHLAAGGDGPVIGTIMTNGGLEAALGGRLHRTPVGDKHVAAAMRETGAALGAEPSGHVLFADGPATSCGLYTALRVLSRGLPRPQVGWTRWPAATRNLRVSARRPLDGLATVSAARAAGARVVVRYSGTEPVVRVLVEGQDARAWADRIAAELEA